MNRRRLILLAGGSMVVYAFALSPIGNDEVNILPGLSFSPEIADKLDYVAVVGADGNWHEWRRTQ